MKLKNIGYAAVVAMSAIGFVLGSTGSSEAAKAKKTAAPPPQPGPCFDVQKQVCGERGGMKFTYANACFANKDGAKVISDKACPAQKAVKAGKKKAKKAMKKAGKKTAKKSAKKPMKKK